MSSRNYRVLRPVFHDRETRSVGSVLDLADVSALHIAKLVEAGAIEKVKNNEMSNGKSGNDSAIGSGNDGDGKSGATIPKPGSKFPKSSIGSKYPNEN